MKGVIAIAGVTCAAMIGAGILVGENQRSHTVPFTTPAVSVAAAQPLSNDGSAGDITFTFDDGPDSYTPALLNEMRKLHLKGVFFAFGWKVQAHPQLMRDELAAGDLVENHTWDHPSFTGVSTRTAPLTAAKIRQELITTNQAIVAAGAPRPTLYRPPFGDITPADNAIAASLGLRIVEPFSVVSHGNVVDSRDWTGATPQQIAYYVEHGSKGHAGIHGGSVIGFHDSAPIACLQEQPLCNYTVNMIRSLPLIVAWMNAHHLGVTVKVPADTTGGTVPNISVR